MKIYLVVLDTLADWEIGYLTAELNSKRMMTSPDAACDIVKVGLTAAPIATMGGITIVPDVSYDTVRMEAEDLLLMPGADKWQAPEYAPLLTSPGTWWCAAIAWPPFAAPPSAWRRPAR